jgi:diguanylate cyclase (GGDEF)-like protein
LIFSDPRFAEAVDASMPELGPAGVPLSVVLLDIDAFGQLNEAVGHPAGHRVLAVVGYALRELVRPLDMVLGGGGDAYLLVLLGADLEVAVARAEETRTFLAELEIPGVGWPLTASFGVATYEAPETPADLFDRAFTAQYRAKALGRDRVEVAQRPERAETPDP